MCWPALLLPLHLRPPQVKGLHPVTLLFENSQQLHWPSILQAEVLLLDCPVQPLTHLLTWEPLRALVSGVTGRSIDA